MSRFLKSALLVMVVLVAADLVLAQLGKVMVPDWSLRTHRLKFRIPDPVFHHALAPQVIQVDRWGGASYRLVTNSLGGRDVEPRVVPLTADHRRVAIIGDSFVEGVGYPFEQTFVGIVHDAMREKNVEVLNLGVSSYSPLLYWRKVQYMLENKGLKFDDLLVFVDPGDILNEALWYDLGPDGSVISNIQGGINAEQRVGGAGDWLAVNSVVGKLMFMVADRWRLHLREKQISDTERTGDESIDTVVNARDASWTYDQKAWDSWGRLGLERAITSLDRLRELTRQHGISLTVAAYPWPGQVWRGQIEARHRLALREWAAANHAGFIDLYPDFLAVPAQQAVKTWFIKGDVHWNDEGHRLVANRVLDYLAPSVKSTTTAQ